MVCMLIVLYTIANQLAHNHMIATYNYSTLTLKYVPMPLAIGTYKRRMSYDDKAAIFFLENEIKL